MDELALSALEQIDKHLNNPNQAWLLGAGIGFDANIPLMMPLTERIAEILNSESKRIYTHIGKNLPTGTHIEHILSHLGDLISLASRSTDNAIEFDGMRLESEQMEALYQNVVMEIRKTIRYGFRKGEVPGGDKVGKKDAPVVDVSQHKEFIRTIFRVGQAGVDTLRPRVHFFTTNYDTLLEDALSFEHVESIDGFSGGSVGYWNASTFDQEVTGKGAVLYKLHGSIDWHIDSTQSLIRCRDDMYPDERLGNVLIYPQQTKYVATQRDPFSQLFKRFRDYLLFPRDQILAICGYSFGDEHINLEIENALLHPKNNTTLLCFVNEPEDAATKLNQLSSTLCKWLSDLRLSKRIFVLTDRGLYWGDNVNRDPGNFHDWWTFKGVTNILKNGIL